LNLPQQHFISLLQIPKMSLEEEHNKIEGLRRIFVGGLPLTVTDTELKEYFATIGEVEKAEVAKDNSDKSKGFGFITFGSLDDYNKCIDHVKETGKKHNISGEDIDVRRSIPKELLQEYKDAQRGEDVKIYMKFSQSFIKDIDEEQIKAFFQKMALFRGNRPKSVEFITNKETKEKTGSAFVKFDDDDDVIKAATVKDFDWNGSQVTCAIAKPKRNSRRFGDGGFGGRGGGRGRGGRGMRGYGPRRGGFGGGNWGNDYNGYGGGYGGFDGYGGGYGGYDDYYDNYNGGGYGGGYGGGGRRYQPY